VAFNQFILYDVSPAKTLQDRGYSITLIETGGAHVSWKIKEAKWKESKKIIQEMGSQKGKASIVIGTI